MKREDLLKLIRDVGDPDFIWYDNVSDAEALDVIGAEAVQQWLEGKGYQVVHPNVVALRKALEATALVDRDRLRLIDPDADDSFAAEYGTLPVSDAEALSMIGRDAAVQHWFTRECSDCGGAGVVSDHAYRPHDTPCPTCEGNGRVPARGVMIDTGDVLIFPLKWARSLAGEVGK